jgi:hypothetical protein
MKTTLKLSLLSLIASLGLAACGGGTCDKAACPNDPAPTSDQITACKALLNDSKCGSKFQAVADCDKGVACGMDGKSDTMAQASACMSQNTAYSQCLTGM